MITNTGEGGTGDQTPGGVQGSNTGSSTSQCVYTLYTEGNTKESIPSGTIELLMPYNVTMLIIRVDKYFNKCLFSRFWSITAYTPEAIELVDNPLNKYVVASYTPGLVSDINDGSITIYVQHQVPTAEKIANWLPVPKGSFNLMLRIYGPQNVAQPSGDPPVASTSFLPKIKRVN